MKALVRLTVILVLMELFTASLSAQRAEIYPNAGGFFPLRMEGFNKFKSDGVYGLKGGVFVGQNAELEGSFGYLNHFELKNPPNSFNTSFGIVQPTVYGVMYDVNVSYNGGERQFLHSRV